MQTPNSTRNWAIAAAVAAMLTASTAAVRAQDASANPTTAPGTTTTTPDTSATGAATPPGTSGAPGTGVGGTVPAPASDSSTSGSSTSGSMGTSGNMSGMPMSGSMGSSSMSSGMLNYSLLNNPNYDYVDLQQAKARGLTDSQIATVAKITTETGVPFSEIARAVERGETFPVLASQYNLKLADVYDVDKEKQQIADYTAAYESLSPKNSSGGSMMSGMDNSMPMAPAPMSGGTSGTMPMTPATPTGGSASSNMATMDIVDTAMAAKNLTTLVRALQVAGLVETLKGAGPFTVFAPDDRAFSRLPAGQLDILMADPAKLKTILTYHVIPADIMASDAMSMTSPTSPPTVEGGTLQVTKGRRGRLRVNDATVTKADIKASNGVIHIIDRVLMPPMDMTTGATGTGTTGAAGATGTTTTGSGTDTTGGMTPGTTGTGTTTPATPPAAPAPGQ